MTTTNIERKVLGHVFKPMTSYDWYGYAGAEEGTLICHLEDSDLLLTPNGEIIECTQDSEVTWFCKDR